MDPSRTPGRPGTLAAIAREANLSVSTISKVLNGQSDVAAGTRDLVEELLRRHGYQRPRTVRRPRRGGLIDLVMNEIDSGWGLAILDGVRRTAERRDLSLVVSAVHDDADARHWVESMTVRGSLGVILVVADLGQRQRLELTRRALPFVVVDGGRPPGDDVPSISAANTEGGRAAAGHLVALGHRRIGVIGGPATLASTRERIAGYRAALGGAGLEVDPALLRYGDYTSEAGLRHGLAMLRLGSPPSAVFAGNDQQASGVYEAARRLGLRVPDDLSVVGFDDIDSSRWATPPLTTVRQPLRAMGATAAQVLLRIVGGERLDRLRVELPTELVVRASTAPPPSSI